MQESGWRTRSVWLVASGVLLAVFGGMVPSAHADTFGFVCITNNNPGDCTIGEVQLFVDVTDPGGGQVLFTFTNVGPEDSSICDVYFQDNIPLLHSIADIDDDDPGVSFSLGAAPGHLPGGNSASPPFQATAGLMADSDPPVQPNGVNPGETLGISFNLLGTLADPPELTEVVDAINGGVLRIGIHVQGFASGGSESFVTVFPEPGCDGQLTACEGYAGSVQLCPGSDPPSCDSGAGTGVCTEPALVSLPAGAVNLDYVDIGDTTSEPGHHLQSWGLVVGQSVPGSGNWGGEDHCRVIWEKGTISKTATIKMDFGTAPGDKFLALRWLDGIANANNTNAPHDGFRLVIAGSPRVYTLQDMTAAHGEDWYDLCVWEVGELCGERKVWLTATGGPWAAFSTYGQVGFSEMETVCAPSASRSSTNTITAMLRLRSVEGLVNRCIRFTARNHDGSCATPVNANVWFAGSPAIGRVTFDIENGDWTELYAKDEQHVLGAKAELVLDGSTFYSDPLLDLRGGDTDNNNIVDIDDVTWLIATFGASGNGGTHPWDGVRCADFSNDGVVATADFTFLATNWLAFGEAFECGSPSSSGGGTGSPPVGSSKVATRAVKTSVSVADLPAWVADRADITRDGVVDVADVKRFEQTHSLGNELSSKIEMTASLKHTKKSLR